MTDLNLRRVLPALLLAVSLAACGGGGGSSSPSNPIPAPVTSTSPIPPSYPNVDDNDNGDDWRSRRYDPSGSGDNEYQQTITESNVATLAPAWIFHGTVGTYSSVAVAEGRVYHTELGGYVYSLDEQTGNQIWANTPVVPESFVPSPLIVSSLLYLPSTTGTFYVANAATGNIAFTYPSISQWGPLFNGNPLGHFRGSPVYENGTVYIGGANHFEADACITGGQIIALDPLVASVRATANLTPNGTTGVGVWSDPVFDASGNMYVATGNSCGFTTAPYGDSMLRVDPHSLNVVWHTQGPVDANDWDFGSTPVVVGNEIVDAGKDGNVYAYDTTSGQLLWKHTGAPFPQAAAISPLATDGKYIVVPFSVVDDRQHGGILVLDLQGNVVWSLKTGGDANHPGKGVVSDPAISHGVLYIGYTKDNCSSSCYGISAFELSSGKELWRYTTQSPIYGGIAIVNGGVFAGEIDYANLYCFRPGGAKAQGRSTPRVVYGTRFTNPYYRSPWINSIEPRNGDNVGPLAPPIR